MHPLCAALSGNGFACEKVCELQNCVLGMPLHPTPSECN